MFAGFNFKIDNEFPITPLNFDDEVKKIEDQKKRIQEALTDYLLSEKEINAESIEKDWFPPGKYNVFISHSHNDYKKVIKFTVWLKYFFGIESFIDSCVWGYSDDLLSLIDNRYCMTLSGKVSKDGVDHYNYKKRNQSTAHVHIVLQSALQKMIDNTECVIFINTPNSLILDNTKGEFYTDSAWIYSELLTTKLIRKKSLKTYREDCLEHGERYDLKVKYKPPTEQLVDLDISDIYWMQNMSFLWKDSPEMALDELYKRKGLLPNG